MVIVDLAAQIDPQVAVFTLDTGRLPAETLDMVETVRTRYGITIEMVRPDGEEVARMVREHGADLFYESTENRALCCEIRKVRPIARKLAGLDAWATGLRREQSANRATVPKVQELDGRVKVSPLADWSRADIEAYIERNNVPVHPLYATGYGSIGCAPCTRALQSGEGERAGRWWWEQDAKKECGIHVSAEGLVRRA